MTSATDKLRQFLFCIAHNIRFFVSNKNITNVLPRFKNVNNVPLNWTSQTRQRHN